MSNEYRRIEVITGDVLRRRWTTEQKPRIIEESFEPGETVSSAARRHGVAPNLLYRWCRLLSEGGKAGAQRITGKRLAALCLGKIATHAGGECFLLDEPGKFIQASSAATGRVVSDGPRPISTSRQSVLPRKDTGAPLWKLSTPPRPSSVWSRPRSSPVISERRRPPAKPNSCMARSRSPRNEPRVSVASMAIRSFGKTASVCRGRAACRGGNNSRRSPRGAV
jgi:hypothetical protein